MKTFVTGGAGFIGSHLVDRLIDDGNTVTAYDNLSSGNKKFLEHLMKNDKFDFIEADLLDTERVKKEIKNHDVVFHISANPFVRLGEKDTKLDLEQGAIVTHNILESMRVNNIKKIVFSSSSVVYAETPPMALPETYGPTLPISLYGAGKLASEGLISAFCGTFGFQTWIYRFANVVGSRSTHGVIIDFINKLKKNSDELEILGDGKQQKPYLHVSDVVNGIIHGFNHSHDQLNLFNLGCDSNTTVTKIAKIVVKEMGLKNVKFVYTGGKRGWKGDVPRFQLDSSKINKLGWKASYTSDEAIRKAIREILDEL
ncbi:MAG: NAD-dependent epimerase/dehydratase family protein [Thermoplasmatales archaeon]|nr:MAG: NAD-dependent epimerase/dehydratase family protein [Thermoplasmatales archaeon]